MLIIGEILKQSLPVGWLLYDPLSFWITQAILLSAVCSKQWVAGRQRFGSHRVSLGQPIKGEWSKGIDGVEVI